MPEEKLTLPLGSGFYAMLVHELYGVDIFEAMAAEHDPEDTERFKAIRRLRALSKRGLFCRIHGKSFAEYASGFGFTADDAADVDRRLNDFLKKYDVKLVYAPDAPNLLLGWNVTMQQAAPIPVTQCVTAT